MLVTMGKWCPAAAIILKAVSLIIMAGRGVATVGQCSVPMNWSRFARPDSGQLDT